MIFEMRLSRSLPVMLLFGALGGCEVREGLQGATGGSGLPTAPSIQPALVGVWSLILINTDATGALVSTSETRWQFDSDGAVARTSIATDFASGIQDVVRSTGRWSATATQVTISLTGSSSMTLPWRIERPGTNTVLVLGTLSFLRR